MLKLVWRDYGVRRTQTPSLYGGNQPGPTPRLHQGRNQVPLYSKLSHRLRQRPCHGDICRPPGCPMSLPIVPDYDNGDADDDSLYSIISTSPGLDTATSPSEYGHDDVDDDFEQFSLDGDGIGDGDGVNSEISCGCSTSVTPSAYEDEVAYGRRYHGFRKGRYPLPNDDLEQRREETNHALMLELTVCVLAFFGTRVNIRGIFLDSCQTIEFRELMATQGGRLFYSDIGKYPHKIIDIGTGTGMPFFFVAGVY